MKRGENVPDMVQLVRYNDEVSPDHLEGTRNIFVAHFEPLAGEGLTRTVMQSTIGLDGSPLRPHLSASSVFLCLCELRKH